MESLDNRFTSQVDFKNHFLTTKNFFESKNYDMTMVAE
jgi:hypothetical protein